MGYEQMRIIAACDACGKGFLAVRESGSVCFCRRGRVWYLAESQANFGKCEQSADREARRRAVVLDRRMTPPGSLRADGAAPQEPTK